MKKYKLYYLFITSILIAIQACDTEDELIEERLEDNPITDTTGVSVSSGTADFSNYVAVGNSITAGFADAALAPETQDDSYPDILATQLQLAGGGAFIQPDISSGNGFGGVDSEGNPLGRSFINLGVALAALAGVEGVEVADAIQSSPGSFLTNSSTTGAGLNNFGVPGARVIDIITPGYGVANVYFGVFQTSAATTIVADAVSADPSFFSLWIGSNDVLGYASSGGVRGETFVPTDPLTITDLSTFTASLQGALDALSAGGADGVILNVPPITVIPFFQTVTELAGGIDLIPLDAFTAGAVNLGYATYNATLDDLVLATVITQEEADLRKISFESGNNPPVILDESLTDLTSIDPALVSMRQARVDATTGLSDLFPLTALSVIGAEAVEGDPTTVFGVGVPIPDESSLTIDEQFNVITAYVGYNAVIAAEVAGRDNLTLVDVGPVFADMFGLTAAQAFGLGLSTEAQAAADGELGIEVSGINLVPLSLTEEELYNSVWSTDGIHPNARGAALITNEIIEVINATYGATIPEVNPLDFAPVNAPL